MIDAPIYMENDANAAAMAETGGEAVAGTAI